MIPDTHPYNIGWRMGEGEFHSGILNPGNLKTRTRLIIHPILPQLSGMDFRHKLKRERPE
jgi:hypothetical protein